MFIPIRNSLQIDNYVASLISSSLYLGIGVGFLASGSLTKYILRNHIVIVCLANMILLNLAFFIFEGVFVFTISRTCIGLCIGIQSPMISGIINDYIPTKRKSFILISITGFLAIGAMYVIFIGLIVVPHYELSRIRLCYFLFLHPLMIVFVFTFLFLKESPRFLILNRKDSEAFEILTPYTNAELISEELQEKIKREVIESNMQSISHRDLSSIFSFPFLTMTILLLFIYTFCYSFTNATRLILSLTLSDSRNLNDSPKSDLAKQMLVYFAYLIGCVGAGFTNDINFLSKKYLTAIGLGMISIIILIPCISQDKIYVSIAIIHLFLPLCLSLINTITAEIYPKNFSEIANLFFGICAKISTFIANFIFIPMASSDIYLPYYIIILLAVISTVMIVFLPSEADLINMGIMRSSDSTKSKQFGKR